jgi:hypothetical protein
MEFDPATNMVSVKTFSPVTNAFETDGDSQFDLSIDLAPTNNFTKLGQLTNVSSGTRPCFTWNDLSPNTEYEWYMGFQMVQQLRRARYGVSLPLSVHHFQ